MLQSAGQCMEKTSSPAGGLAVVMLGKTEPVPDGISGSGIAVGVFPEVPQQVFLQGGG